MTILSGWLGYGMAVSGSGIVEPSDLGYTRQPVAFSDINTCTPSRNLFPATFGPAASAWGLLTCAGVFDAPGGGNLLAFWSLAGGLTVPVGRTLAVTVGSISLVFDDTPGLMAAGQRSFGAGQRMGSIHHGAGLFAGVASTVTA